MRFSAICVLFSLGLAALGQEPPAPAPGADPKPVPTEHVAEKDGVRPAAAPAPEARPQPKAEDIAQWIEQLHAEKYEDRVAARKQLFEAGLAALPALEKALTRSSVEDMETFESAKQLIFEIKRQEYRDRFLKAKDLVELNDGIKIKLLKSGDGPVLSTPRSWIRLQPRLLNGKEFEGCPWKEERTNTALLKLPANCAEEYKVGSTWLLLVPRKVLLDTFEPRSLSYKDCPEPVYVFELTVDEQPARGRSSSGGPIGFGDGLP